jgi:tetratricopeptide (TPR) repeat protein
MKDEPTPAADEANEEGRAALDEGRLEVAEAAFRRATDLDPAWSSPWFNLGLVYKLRRDWPACLRANDECLKRCDDDEGARWNLGIAATATSTWDQYRRAWRSFGVEVPEGEGPFDLGLGLVPIRLDPEGDRPEVVWCRRTDPATAVIENVPLPESGYRWRDRLLHDGEPRGVRRLGDSEVAVFDMLELLEVSPYSTFEVDLRAGTPEEYAVLEDLAGDSAHHTCEDWSESIRMLCRACSEGDPDAGDHDHPPELATGEARRFGLSAESREAAEELLERWVAGGEGRSFLLRL